MFDMAAVQMVQPTRATLFVVFICHVVCANGPDVTSFNIAYVDETVTISCPLTDTFTYPSWFGPNGPRIAGTGSPDINTRDYDRIRYDINQRDLILTDVTKVDAGTYLCSKTIGGFLKQGHQTLHVRVLPNLPVITEASAGVVTGTEGQLLTLTCVCQGGFPAPTLAWYKNTATPPAVPVRSTPPTDSSATSVIDTYTFIPSKNDDKIICQSSFTDPLPETMNQTSVQVYLNLKPSTPTVHQVGDVTAGSTATLQCDTSGFRPQAINISWTYSGTIRIGSMSTWGLDNDKYSATSTLQLPVQRGDNIGSVECIVDHSTMSTSLSGFTAMDVHFKPVSATVSGNTQTEVGGTIPLTLTCSVGDAHPTANHFTWTGPSVGALTQTVTLRPRRDQDRATITCTASNYVGSATSQAEILDLTYHPITNISDGTSITKTEGDGAIVLHCSTNSKPASNIIWYHDGNQVSQVTNLNELNYNLGKVHRTDTGTYTCMADNGITGTPADREKSITLAVLFPPLTVGLTGNILGMVVNGANTLNLTCTTGYSRPVSTVAWKKGSSQISTDITPIAMSGTQYGGTRYRETLTLTPTRDDDSAIITCSAQNNVTRPVRVETVKLNLTYYPITTITEGTSITQTEGYPGLVLHCSTDSKPVSTITWSPNNNTPVIHGTNINHLDLGTVHRTDAGTYKCTADNGIPGATVDKEKSVTLAVLFPPMTVELTGNNPGMEVNGATLTLTCTADYSRPVSTIAWRKGSSQIPAGTPTVILGSQYGGTRYRETLTLTPTREDDHAVITCSAWNNVTAQPLVKNVQFDLRYSPEASITDWPNTVIEGTPYVDLTCIASSKPPATFTWYKYTTILGTHTGTLAHNSWSYRINKVNRTDSGQYHCTASNEISSVAVQTMTLTVHYPPDVTATGHDGTVNDTSVAIACSPTGIPDTYTYYSWVHSWGGHVISQPELPATQTLTLTGLTYQHSGVYTCRVSNGVAPYGTADITTGSTSFIIVKSHPVINYPELGVKKVHTLSTKLHHPTNINITYYSNVDGTTVSFHRVVNNVAQSALVGVVTTETAVIQLKMLDNSTVPASGTRATATLTIDNESELGLYQLKVLNIIGTATIDIQIKAEGPPEPPEHPAVSGVSATSVNVSWNLGFHGGLDQTFAVQYSTDGVAWTNGATLDTGLNESPSRHHVYVDSLSPGQLYYMRIYANNEKGQSDYTDTFNVTTSTPETDGESAASTDIGPIVGGLVAALVVIIIVVVACVLVLYKKGYRINGPGNTRDKYSAHVYENDLGTDRRKSPNVAHRVPATTASHDKGQAGTTSAGTGPGALYDEVDGNHQVGARSRDESPSAKTSAGTGPGPVYEPVDGDPQVGAGSRDESITATYEMLERRQSENRTYDELRLPAPTEYENTRIP